VIPAARTARARGSDGKTYTLHITQPAGGPRVVVTSGGEAVAEDARGNLWVSGTGTRLELIPEPPPAHG
jgi:hypothetical protein